MSLPGIPPTPITHPTLLGIFTKLWHSARNPPPPPPTHPFTNKTILVTGANTGLGFEAALLYASARPSKLLLAVRSPAKGEAAAQRIRERYPDVSISVLALDLSSFASIRSFTDTLATETGHLDIALLNAGVSPTAYTTTPDGWETTAHVNLLSTALLAALLLPLLRRAPQPAHLCFVNSIAHAQVQPAWLEPHGGSILRALNNGGEGFESMRWYALSKLGAMAAMQGIARTEAAREVVVNSCCPFLCRTEIRREWGVVAGLVRGGFEAVLAKSAEEGARVLVGATGLGEGSAGGFWHEGGLHPVGDLARDEEFMRRTWEEVLEVIEEVEPGVREVVGGCGPGRK